MFSNRTSPCAIEVAPSSGMLAGSQAARRAIDGIESV